MASLADVVAAPVQTVTIAGTDYPIKTFSMLTIGRLQAAINAIPDPKPWKEQKAKFEEIRDAGGITAEECAAMVNEAVKDSLSWPPEILGDPRVNQLMHSNIDLMAAFVGEALRMPIEQAKTLLGDISIDAFTSMMDVGFNAQPSVSAETKSDPKAPAPAIG